MNDKKNLGQFFTTNYKYILQDTYFPENTNRIIEPFTGLDHLLQLTKEGTTIEKYDIDPKSEGTIKRDTLKNPLNYEKAFVITNPPFFSKK